MTVEGFKDKLATIDNTLTTQEERLISLTRLVKLLQSEDSTKVGNSNASVSKVDLLDSSKTVR